MLAELPDKALIGPTKESVDTKPVARGQVLEKAKFTLEGIPRSIRFRDSAPGQCAPVCALQGNFELTNKEPGQICEKKIVRGRYSLLPYGCCICRRHTSGDTAVTPRTECRLGYHYTPPPRHSVMAALEVAELSQSPCFALGLEQA